ncbi:CvfD/Ygs/GSP13 family RNA-binding post-transcriptional regulator [Vagococcus xieshaowenii]|uniref:S1 RNA-binding domain-containing protein n=1 Tax=Vagococcus xieshaowenii TaxID=2562451 RepID=A0AAJ5JMC2_9ENTE|nr:CvfD/Ygs/GSP13 family RNA-binding post-transcriptional regulator [Vagococcus xieshaowenii]QCA28999.1 S1 RNA-binding domain-containing protein [Vagococcus xieshaowenii]TFZ41025.1 S1 RNA-binding domain-containing protein [Vagococcus xieshaowenii]
MKYKIGDVVTGTITGLQPYGAFVSLDAQNQGLIHISEIRYGYIKNIKEVVSVGDEVRVKVIDIDEFSHKISLSMRALESHQADALNKRKKFFTNPKLAIGFSTLDSSMAHWVDDSLDSLKNNK